MQLLRTVGHYVNHDDVFVRAASFWAFCAVVFVAVWVLSYHLLPKGLLRGTSLAYFAPVETERAETTFMRVFAWNIVFASILVLSNTFRSVETPMGYLALLVVVVQGALVWGTGSLALATGRIEPSLGTVVGRSGVFELSAYVLIAVSTRGVMLWHQREPPRLREEFVRVRSVRDWSLSRRELLVLLAGIGLLAAANYREASMIAELG
ncbi:MAG: hypothetical protein U5J64_12130 [Halobacteriales archaeon]|nr:hypothetical protein [Halobacteriales archaeon]